MKTCSHSRFLCVQKKQHGHLWNLHERQREGEADSSLPPALQPCAPRAGEGTTPFSSDDPLRDVPQSYQFGWNERAAAMGDPIKPSARHVAHGLAPTPDLVMRCAGCETCRDTAEGALGHAGTGEHSSCNKSSLRQTCLGWNSAEGESKLQEVPLATAGSSRETAASHHCAFSQRTAWFGRMDPEPSFLVNYWNIAAPLLCFLFHLFLFSHLTSLWFSQVCTPTQSN